MHSAELATAVEHLTVHELKVLEVDPMRVAVHEAGHAIAILAHGRRFRYVTLRPRDPDLRGVVWPYPSRIGPFAQMVISCAGPAAEAKWLAGGGEPSLEQWDQAWHDGGEGDLQTLEAATATLLAPSVDQSADRAASAAQGILDDFWSEVCLVAARLVAVRTMTCGETLRLLETADYQTRPAA